MAVYENGELVLYGFVGDSFWDDGFTAREVITALAEHGRDSDITVRVNSGGGHVHEGVGIYNALKSHRGKVRVEVDGVALSSASLLAMAGDEIVMKAGALMMIHDPAGITIGTAQDHEKKRDELGKVGDSMAAIYAERSGNDVAGVRAAMKEELWLTAEEAVEQGYANEAESAKAQAVAAFDYRIYAHAPDNLKTLARKKNWSFPKTDSAARAASPRLPKETSMTEKPTTEKTMADLTPAEIDKAKADAADKAAKASAAAAEIVDICMTAGVPSMAAALIREGVTIDQAKARTDTAKEIRAAVALARKSFPGIEASAADAFIAAGMSMETVRSKLFEQITAAQSPEITAAHQSNGGQDEAAALAASIVTNFRAATKRSA